MPGKSTPLPFEKLSSTRWLVRGKVMNNILANWYELKAYFELSDDPKRYETRYKARLIKEMMQDHKNYLYFQFAVPIVQEFETVNSLFQHTNIDPTILDTELYTHYESLHGRLYHPDGTPKGVRWCRFWVQIYAGSSKVCNSTLGNQQIFRDVEDLKRRCKDVLEEALSQLKLRMPASRNTFQNLAKLSSTVILNQATRPKFYELPFLHVIPNQLLSKTEEQYRKIVFVNWTEQTAFLKHGLVLETEVLG
ncbi:Zinc finger mym-type protein 1 [Plakobranchus ocellatus]|uniref:Zinc finger mym-type protein 1 n=1 Tax=Plakobranchus ocellatus TaxID=259542 RepID=A0AAV4ANJ8_9GAST|nr:Zinc finger mym-type protein 1 [Plakobranchus ocellatus]